MGLLSHGATLTGSTGVNGDSFFISSDNKVFVLSDGASGAGKDGKVIMSNTCVEMAKLYEFASSKLDPKAYVDFLFWKINNRLIELSQGSRTLLYGTIIIAVIENDTLTVTTFGDSPAFLFSGGTIKQVARNRKRYEDMIEVGYITRDEYDSYIKQMHERMWSCFDYFLPEIVPNNVIEQYVIRNGDMLLMCCDGLSDWITPGSMFTVLSEKGMENGIDSLITLAKERSLDTQSSYDDITAIAIQCC